MDQAPHEVPAKASLKLEVQILPKNSPHRQTLEQRLTATFTQKLTAAGYKLAQDADQTLRVVWGDNYRGSGYHSWGFSQGDSRGKDGKPKTALPMQVLRATVSLIETPGFGKPPTEAYWREQAIVYPPAIEYQVNWAAADPGEDLQKQFDQALLRRLELIDLPTRVLENKSHPFGRSQFDLNGEEGIIDRNFAGNGR